MAKKKREKIGIGRVIWMSQSDLKLLKQHFLNLENKGVTISREEICNNIFSLGLHAEIKSLQHES